MRMYGCDCEGRALTIQIGPRQKCLSQAQIYDMLHMNLGMAWGLNKADTEGEWEEVRGSKRKQETAGEVARKG